MGMASGKAHRQPVKRISGINTRRWLIIARVVIGVLACGRGRLIGVGGPVGGIGASEPLAL